MRSLRLSVNHGLERIGSLPETEAVAILIFVQRTDFSSDPWERLRMHRWICAPRVSTADSIHIDANVVKVATGVSSFVDPADERPR
jgi:hypothetical protein